MAKLPILLLLPTSKHEVIHVDEDMKTLTYVTGLSPFQQEYNLVVYDYYFTPPFEEAGKDTPVKVERYRIAIPDYKSLNTLDVNQVRRAIEDCKLTPYKTYQDIS